MGNKTGRKGFVVIRLAWLAILAAEQSFWVGFDAQGLLTRTNISIEFNNIDGGLKPKSISELASPTSVWPS